MKKEPKIKMQCQANTMQLESRLKMQELFVNSPLPTEQLMVNLPMYIRSSCLAKLLYINELYELIIRVPGVIMEFGSWWGCNLVLFENLRAIYEPYNYTRKIIGFDTYSGYRNLSEKDGTSDKIIDGNYSVNENSMQHLIDLMGAHSQENVMSNIKKYELIKGDASTTIKKYFVKHPETIIAMAYFDMQLYEPTKICLKEILPHLTKGSCIAMDEINNQEFPGETVAFNEIIGTNNCRLIRSKYLPDRSYFIFE